MNEKRRPGKTGTAWKDKSAPGKKAETIFRAAASCAQVKDGMILADDRTIPPAWRQPSTRAAFLTDTSGLSSGAEEIERAGDGEDTGGTPNPDGFPGKKERKTNIPRKSNEAYVKT